MYKCKLFFCNTYYIVRTNYYFSNYIIFSKYKILSRKTCIIMIQCVHKNKSDNNEKDNTIIKEYISL